MSAPLQRDAQRAVPVAATPIDAAACGDARSAACVAALPISVAAYGDSQRAALVAATPMCASRPSRGKRVVAINLDVPPPPAPVPPDFEGAGEIIRNRVSGHPNVAKFAPLIERHASANGLDPALVKAVVAVESAFDPAAVSPKGAIGLMQVIPATGERYGLQPDRRRSVEQKLLDPATNVRIGTRYLADLLRRFDNDLVLALAGYNAGEGAVLRHARRVPPFAETRAYVELVQQFRDWYTPPPAPPPRPTRVVVPRQRAAGG
jgi:soluble lytic murein transglycosylase-like protein